jgi:hypothetical protein
VVNLNGNNAPLLSIQSSYIGHQIAVGIYDNNGELVGVSDVVTLDGKVIVPVVTAIEKEVDGAIKVSNTAELRKALTEVASNGKNDTIVLSAGTYKTTDDGQGTFTYSSSEDYNLTIKSANGLSRDDVVLDGDNSNRIFNLNINGKTINLEKISIRHGYSNQNGGAIYFGSGTIIVKDSNISNNKVRYTGSAYIGAGNGSDGAGIYTSNGDIVVKDSILSYNDSDGHGGALYTYNGDIVVKDSILDSNNAKMAGGLWVYEGDLYISRSSIVNNKVIYWGAGAVMFDGKTYVDNSIFYNNHATQSSGGSLVVSGNTDALNQETIVVNTIFSHNSCSLDDYSRGGGFYSNRNKTLLINSTFVNNSDDGFAGQGILINNIFNNSLSDIQLDGTSQLYNNYFDITKIINPLNITIDENNIDASMNNLTFVDSDYRLSSNAITVDKGLNPIDDTFKNLFTADEYAKVIQMMQTDKDGNARVSGNGIDIGAYEFNGGTENQPNESDTTPPNAPTLTTTPPLSTTANSIDIEVNGEAESHIYVNHEEVTILGLDGRAFITLNLIYEGENHFDLTLRDNSGNESEVFGFTITKELSNDGGNSDSIDDGLSNPSIGGNPDDGMGGF